MSLVLPSRRTVFAGSAAGGGLLLAGCDQLSGSTNFLRVLGLAEQLTYRSQRLLLGPETPLAREFSAADISPVFKPNGTVSPRDPAYLRQQADGFANWRLTVDGMVRQPFSLSLAELRALPARTQITRHDCVEGWSAIGQWTGPQLWPILQAAAPLPSARYAVFFCADTLGGEPELGPGLGRNQYYESVDLADARHPQTILAHSLNGGPLPVSNGAPLRLRVERQLGYKHAKYVFQVRLVDDLRRIGRGRGGYWEDRGYEWYAGV